MSAVVTGNPGAGGKAKSDDPSSYMLGGTYGSLYSSYLQPITTVMQDRLMFNASVGSAGSGAGGSLWTVSGGIADYGAGGGGGGSGGNGGFLFLYAKSIVLNGSGDWLTVKGGNGGNGGIGDMGYVYAGITGVSGGGGGGGGVGGTAVVVYQTKTGSMTENCSKGTKGTGGTAAGGYSENGFDGTDGTDGKVYLLPI
ncbi:MAG: hypothetical protein M0R06_01940 [Sphaerochaeta sp.]|jgi:hypothetical protein|nr:hypothetical protein [Sphaerochaeta sp.]